MSIFKIAYEVPPRLSPRIQCQQPMPDTWVPGYRAQRAKYNGHDMRYCMKLARHEVGDKVYCTQHARLHGKVC